MNKLMKSFVILFFVSMMLMASAVPVLADVGPKPTVNLEIRGIEGEYYVTLLSDVESTGPYHNQGPYSSENHDYHIFEDYDDEFHFLYNMNLLEGEGEFDWNYYPPEVYKVLVYIPETDTYLESDIVEAYAFNSYHLVRVEDNSIRVTNVNKLMFNLGDYLIRLVLTVIIELLIALLFRFSRKSLGIIVVTNIITQTILIALLMYLNYRIGYFGEMLTMIPLELVVLVSEIIIYRRFLELDRHPVIYAVVANLLSFLMGFYLLIYFI